MPLDALLVGWCPCTFHFPITLTIMIIHFVTGTRCTSSIHMCCYHPMSLGGLGKSTFIHRIHILCSVLSNVASPSTSLPPPLSLLLSSPSSPLPPPLSLLPSPSSPLPPPLSLPSVTAGRKSPYPPGVSHEDCWIPLFHDQQGHCMSHDLTPCSMLMSCDLTPC